MKHQAIIFCALTAIVVGAQFITAQNPVPATEPEHIGTVYKIEAPNDGMFFNVLSVVDNVWYGTGEDGAWYLIYDDADTGMFYEAIRVTKATYFRVLEAIENGQELCGRLYATQEYETVEYELKTEKDNQ